MPDNPSPLDELERLKAEYDAASKTRSKDFWDARARFHEAIQFHADWLISAARERDELRASMQRIKEHAAYGDEWSVESGGRYRDILAEAESALELDAAIDAARKQGE